MHPIVERATRKLPAETQLILLGEYGSSAHGVALDQSDFDYMGIAVESPAVIFGIDSYEHTRLSELPEGTPTPEGEMEGTIYALKKFAKLAEGGNTAIQSALYLPDYVVCTEAGKHLVNNRSVFLSRNVLKRFAGHLSTERRRMNGDLREKVLRPALVEKHGFDTKAAYQAVKLAFLGRDFALCGEITIPFGETERDFILALRRGEIPREDIDSLLEEIVTLLDWEAEVSKLLPAQSERSKINKLLQELFELSRP